MTVTPSARYRPRAFALGACCLLVLLAARQAGLLSASPDPRLSRVKLKAEEAGEVHFLVSAPLSQRRLPLVVFFHDAAESVNEEDAWAMLPGIDPLTGDWRPDDSDAAMLLGHADAKPTLYQRLLGLPASKPPSVPHHVVASLPIGLAAQGSPHFDGITIVAPAAGRLGWRDGAALAAFVGAVHRRYPNVGGRSWLVGTGSGAMAAWAAAKSDPSAVAALLLVSPPTAPDEATARAVKSIPIRVSHGRGDAAEGMRAAAAFRAAGNGRVAVAAYDADRPTSWTRAFGDPETWRWLRATAGAGG